MRLIGHRGARNEAPENTLTGFRHIHALGIQSVEFDLQLSADNQIVVIHDDTLDRTTNAQGPVSALNAIDLKALDASSHFSQELPKDGVPLLEEVLACFDKLEHAQLEVKPPKAGDHGTFCRKIKECVDELNIKDQCVITSSDVEFLETCKNQAKDMRRGYIYYDLDRKPIETALELECRLLVIYWKFCTEELINEAHSKGLEVSAWTVNEAKAFDQLNNWGIDSIITDCPSGFL